jgi:hypothetical protein
VSPFVCSTPPAQHQPPSSLSLSASVSVFDSPVRSARYSYATCIKALRCIRISIVRHLLSRKPVFRRYSSINARYGTRQDADATAATAATANDALSMHKTRFLSHRSQPRAAAARGHDSEAARSAAFISSCRYAVVTLWGGLGRPADARAG